MKLVLKQRDWAQIPNSTFNKKNANKYELQLKFLTVAFQTALRYFEIVPEWYHINGLIAAVFIGKKNFNE